MEANRTILFADVRGSTALTEQLGDVQSRQLMGALMEELGALTVAHGGTVIKTIGDEIMCAFEEPAQAAAAAVQMQRDLVARPPVQGIQPQVGVGFNAGPVVIEAGDMFGDVVNVAARVVSNAVAGQILTTQQTLDGIAEAGPMWRSLGEHFVKGREEQVHLCEILWRGETAQLTTLAPKLFAAQRSSLELRVGMQVVRTGSDETQDITLGRGVDNALVVPGTSASRRHAKVTSRSGRFYLEDHSTNGTYVRQDEGEEIVVHRDEILLTGSGYIRLGDPLGEEGTLDIEFETSGD